MSAAAAAAFSSPRWLPRFVRRETRSRFVDLHARVGPSAGSFSAANHLSVQSISVFGSASIFVRLIGGRGFFSLSL